MSTAVLRVLERIAKADNPAQALREAIAEERGEQKRSRAARKAKRGLAPGKSRGQRKKERDARWSVIKAEVRKRVETECYGLCEWCVRRPCHDPHHIINGGGRTAHEATDTVAGICRTCHDKYEEGDGETLGLAWAWARLHGFMLALREIEHRTAKAEEARRTTEL